MYIFQVHLGDSALIIEVEKDYTVYGDELKFGGGKVKHSTELLLYILYDQHLAHYKLFFLSVMCRF